MKETITKLLSIIICSSLLLLLAPSIYVSAQEQTDAIDSISRDDYVDENGFHYYDEGKTDLCEIPNIENVVIPEGVKYISNIVSWKDGTPKDLSSVKTITLPSTVVNVDGLYAYLCPNLTQIVVSPENDKFVYSRGILYSWAGKHIVCALGNVVSGDLVLNSNVISIGSHAFENCTKITSITFPKAFKSEQQYLEYGDLDGSFFKGCVNLKEFRVKKGNKHFKTADGVLYNKTGTVLVACPPGKSGKCTILEGVMLIEYGAFSTCTKLTKVTIPYGVTEIKSSAFSNCDSLTSITIPASVVKMWGAIENCDNVHTIKFLGETVPDPGMQLSSEDVCPNLKKILVPKQCRKIYLKNSYIKEDEKLVNEGNYKVKEKNVTKLDKPIAQAYMTSKKIRIEWKQVLYAKGYHIQVKTGNKWKTVDTRTGGNVTFYDRPLKEIGIKSNKNHLIRVVAYANDKVTSASKAISFGPMITPKLLSVKNTGKGTITVRWTTNQYADGYCIMLMGADGSRNTVRVKGRNVKTKKVTGLQKNITYKVSVYAYRDGFQSETKTIPERISDDSNVIKIRIKK